MLTLKQLREALKGSAIPTNPPKPRGEKAFADLHTINLTDRLQAPQSNTAPTETGSADRSHKSAGGEKAIVQQGSSKVNGFFKTITGKTLPPNSKDQGDLKPLGSPSRVKGIAEGLKKKINEGVSTYDDLSVWTKIAKAKGYVVKKETNGKWPQGLWTAMKDGKVVGKFDPNGYWSDNYLKESVVTEGHDLIMVAIEKIATGKYPDGKDINGNHRITFSNGKTVTVNRGTASSMYALSKSISPERAAKMAAHIETGPMAFLKVADFAVSSHA